MVIEIFEIATLDYLGKQKQTKKQKKTQKTTKKTKPPLLM
jgi:hypothetical protein